MQSRSVCFARVQHLILQNLHAPIVLWSSYYNKGKYVHGNKNGGNICTMHTEIQVQKLWLSLTRTRIIFRNERAHGSRYHLPTPKTICVVRFDQPSEDVPVSQVVDTSYASTSLQLCQLWHTRISAGICMGNRSPFPVVYHRPICMGDLSANGMIDHPEDVPDGDSSGGIFIISEFDIDRPLWNCIMNDPHLRDRRGRRSLTKLTLRNQNELFCGEDPHWRKGWRRQVKVEIAQGRISVQKRM